MGSVDLLNKPSLVKVNTTPRTRSTREAKHKHSVKSVSSTEAKEHSYTARNYQLACFLLASPVLDKDGIFSLSTAMAQATAIFELKDMKMANSAMSTVFTSMMDKFSF
jgi:hypothetical protein